MPDDIEEMSLASQSWKILDLLTETNLTESKSEARRLIQQGGVKIDGEKVSDAQTEIELNGDQISSFKSASVNI